MGKKDDISLDIRKRGRVAFIDGRTGDEAINDELAELVAELETDQNIRLNLDHVPAIHQPTTAGDRAGNSGGEEPLPGVQVSDIGGASAFPAIVYRDRDDVRTILNMTWVMMLLVTVLVASGAGNIYQYYRRPDRIVVDGGSGRVLSINDRNYGREDGVEFGADKLTGQDKLYIAREFVRALYQVNPETRARDIERALTMMVPDSAVKFARWMREKGILDQQKTESWQAIWTPLDVSVDKNDPYTVNVIGKQDITRVVNGVALKEITQLRLTMKLVADNKGRADRNLRSGFLIALIDGRQLNEPNPGARGQDAPVSGGLSEPSGASVTPVTGLLDR